MSVIETAAEGAVEGDRVGALVLFRFTWRAGDGAGVEAVAPVFVVRLPGGVGDLQQDRCVAGVVAHDEDDLAFATRAGRGHLGHVDARDGVARHGPFRRHAPVAAVDQARGRFFEAFGLVLHRDRGDARGHHAGPVAAVVAEAQDFDFVGGRRRVDLEMLGFADVDAHRGGVALEVGVADALDLPVARLVPGERVLARDRVFGRGAVVFFGARGSCPRR